MFFAQRERYGQDLTANLHYLQFFRLQHVQVMIKLLAGIITLTRYRAVGNQRFLDPLELGGVEQF